MTAAEAKVFTLAKIYKDNLGVIKKVEADIKAEAIEGRTKVTVEKLNNLVQYYLREQGYVVTDEFPIGSRIFWG